MITGAFFYEFYRIFHMNVERNDLFSILGHEIFVIIYNWSKIVTHSSQIPSIDCFSSFLTSGVILMKLLFFSISIEVSVDGTFFGSIKHIYSCFEFPHNIPKTVLLSKSDRTMKMQCISMCYINSHIQKLEKIIQDKIACYIFL